MLTKLLTDGLDLTHHAGWQPDRLPKPLHVRAQTSIEIGCGVCIR
jgi:hypothetical protein